MELHLCLCITPMEIVAHFKHYSLAMDFYALGHPHDVS